MYHHELVDISNEEFPFKLVLHQHYRPITVIPKHWHRSFEVNFNYKGSIDLFTINNKRFEVEAEEFLLINSNDVHSVESVNSGFDNNIALTILFPVSFMEKEVESYSNRYFYQPINMNLDEGQSYAFTQCKISLSKVVEELLNPTSYSRLIILTNIYQFLLLITKEFSTYNNSSHIWKSKLDLELMTTIINYIDTHYMEPLSISFLANQFHLSEGHFSRFFKKYMNMSVMSYVQEIRLRSAYQLLLNTDLPVNVISDQSGFPNSKSLNSFFKKKYNLSPAKYRNKYS